MATVGQKRLFEFSEAETAHKTKMNDKYRAIDEIQMSVDLTNSVINMVAIDILQLSLLKTKDFRNLWK